MKTEPTEALKILDETRLNPIHEIPRHKAELAANIAFQEGQSSPKIRQLEWRYDKSDKIYIAELSMFEYRVWQDNDKSFMKAMINNNHCTILRFRTIDEAKAAAQADFEKRVNECLE